MSAERPKCVNCGKPLGKYILQVSVPFDENPEDFIWKKWFDLDCKLMDKPEKIREWQHKQATAYADRMERAREARLSLADGSNEVVNNPQWPASILERTIRHRLEDTARDLPKSMYSVLVRVWRGEYGYDRAGVFHSGECARTWGTTIALQLRKKGKV